MACIFNTRLGDSSSPRAGGRCRLVLGPHRTREGRAFGRRAAAVASQGAVPSRCLHEAHIESGLWLFCPDRLPRTALAPGPQSSRSEDVRRRGWPTPAIPPRPPQPFPGDPAEWPQRLWVAHASVLPPTGYRVSERTWGHLAVTTAKVRLCRACALDAASPDSSRLGF